MKTILIGIVVIVVVAIGAVTLLGGNKAGAPAATTPPTSSTTTSSSDSIIIKDYAFTPKTQTVKKGTSVIWTNQDVARHNIVADDGAPAGGPNGPLFGRGETFKFTFDTVGTFNYHCSPHPYMHGTVIVTE